MGLCVLVIMNDEIEHARRLLDFISKQSRANISVNQGRLTTEFMQEIIF